jgi:uncharacterized protein YaiL (DUF2058 family)
MTKKLERKKVEMGKKRIPLRKLLHGKDIRTAAKALEDFRLAFNEQEMLYGATLTIKMDSYGEAVLYAHRLETDNEMNKRLDAARIAAEEKAERERKRKLQEAERAKKLAAERKQNVAQRIKEMVISNGLSIEEITEIIKAS